MLRTTDMEPLIWKIFVSLGVPGLALGVLYVLFRQFKWQFPQVPRPWVGPIVVLFIVTTAGLVYAALYFWAPVRPFTRTELTGSNTRVNYDIGGKWEAKLDEYLGPQALREGRCVFDFAVSGDQVLGTVKDEGHYTREIREGKIAGDQISFTTLTEWAKSPPTIITLKGTIIGDKIDFIMQTPAWGMWDPSVQRFQATRTSR